jgi:hypothetical protein
MIFCMLKHALIQIAPHVQVLKSDNARYVRNTICWSMEHAKWIVMIHIVYIAQETKQMIVCTVIMDTLTQAIHVLVWINWNKKLVIRPASIAMELKQTNAFPVTLDIYCLKVIVAAVQMEPLLRPTLFQVYHIINSKVALLALPILIRRLAYLANMA